MMSHFNIVDIVIIAIISLSVITGLFRGFLKELIALFIWIVAIWLGYSYGQDVGNYLKSYISSDSIRLAVGFIIILLSTVIVGGLCNAFFSFILKTTGLTGTDRILGMGFGFIRGVFIVSLLILVIKMTSLFSTEDYITKSYLYVKFSPLVDWLYSLSPNFINHVQSIDT